MRNASSCVRPPPAAHHVSPRVDARLCCHTPRVGVRCVLWMAGSNVSHGPIVDDATDTRQRTAGRIGAYGERRMITAGSWAPPSSRRAINRTAPVTVGDYAPRWLAGRKVQGRPLADRTRDHYQDLLERFILPTFRRRRAHGRYTRGSRRVVRHRRRHPDLSGPRLLAVACDHAYRGRPDQAQRHSADPVQPLRHLRRRLVRDQTTHPPGHSRGGCDDRRGHAGPAQADGPACRRVRASVR
jgi:hypothetical protein